MALPQATPGLLSLKIRRTAESIATLDTRAAAGAPPAAQDATEIDHSEEKSKIFSLLEQQCFSFVAFRNQIRDARARQASFVEGFRSRARELGNKLDSLSRLIEHRVETLNQRISNLAGVVSPQPLFQQLVRAAGAGRITGMAAQGNYMALTTAHGMIVTVECSTWKIASCVKAFESEGLFGPRLFPTRDGKLTCFAVSSGKKLVLCAPLDSVASRCVGEGVECFDCAVVPDQGECVVVLGRPGALQFAKLSGDDGGRLTMTGTCDGLSGAVRHLVYDEPASAVYAVTARRQLYSVCSESMGVLASRHLDALPLQMQLTQMFLVVSVAPNEIMFFARHQERLSVLMKVTITAGLRHFACSKWCLIVVTKEQTVERRPLGSPHDMELICNMDASDCDEDAYISMVYADGTSVYLAHDDGLSVWR